jgi:hypothetical protein
MGDGVVFAHCWCDCPRDGVSQWEDRERFVEGEGPSGAVPVVFIQDWSRSVVFFLGGAWQAVCGEARPGVHSHVVVQDCVVDGGREVALRTCGAFFLSACLPSFFPCRLTFLHGGRGELIYYRGLYYVR